MLLLKAYQSVKEGLKINHFGCQQLRYVHWKSAYHLATKMKNGRKDEHSRAETFRRMEENLEAERS